MIKLATGGLKPDLTLFFDISIENALKRMSARNETGEKVNRMDFEAIEFYERVRDAYLGISKREPKRFKPVDANGSIAEIHASVLQSVGKFLKLPRHS